MIISVSNHSQEPLYLQIERQLQTAVLTGALVPGEVLPSLRQLAADTGVSLITTKRVYEDLEAQGWITAQPGRGTVVAELNPTLLQERRIQLVGEKLAEARELAVRLRLDRDAADELWKHLWEEE